MGEQEAMERGSVPSTTRSPRAVTRAKRCGAVSSNEASRDRSTSSPSSESVSSSDSSTKSDFVIGFVIDFGFGITSRRNRKAVADAPTCDSRITDRSADLAFGSCPRPVIRLSPISISSQTTPQAISEKKVRTLL